MCLMSEIYVPNIFSNQESFVDKNTYQSKKLETECKETTYFWENVKYIWLCSCRWIPIVGQKEVVCIINSYLLIVIANSIISYVVICIIRSIIIESCLAFCCKNIKDLWLFPNFKFLILSNDLARFNEVITISWFRWTENILWFVCILYFERGSVSLC
jgi:hypothetical protein